MVLAIFKAVYKPWLINLSQDPLAKHNYAVEAERLKELLHDGDSRGLRALTPCFSFSLHTMGYHT